MRRGRRRGTRERETVYLYLISLFLSKAKASNVSVVQPDRWVRYVGQTRALAFRSHAAPSLRPPSRTRVRAQSAPAAPPLAVPPPSLSPSMAAGYPILCPTPTHYAPGTAAIARCTQESLQRAEGLPSAGAPRAIIIYVPIQHCLLLTAVGGWIREKTIWFALEIWWCTGRTCAGRSARRLLLHCYGAIRQARATSIHLTAP